VNDHEWFQCNFSAIYHNHTTVVTRSAVLVQTDNTNSWMNKDHVHVVCIHVYILYLHVHHLKYHPHILILCSVEYQQNHNFLSGV